MFKENKQLLIIALIAVSAVNVSFIADLEYRDVIGGELKVRIPKDFIHITKESYKKHYEDEPSPDDYYCNKDTSEDIAFVKLPRQLPDLSLAKQMGQMALIDSTNKIHFNDTTTVNGNKIYLLDLDGMGSGKMKYVKTFVINTHAGSILGVIECNIDHKKTWKPTSDQIFNSIKIK